MLLRTKSLIQMQRLACVPWLLLACLGWVGEAAAQTPSSATGSATLAGNTLTVELSNIGTIRWSAGSRFDVTFDGTNDDKFGTDPELSLDPDGAENTGQAATPLPLLDNPNNRRWQIPTGSSFGPSATLVFTLPDDHTLVADDQFELSYGGALSVEVTINKSAIPSGATASATLSENTLTVQLSDIGMIDTDNSFRFDVTDDAKFGTDPSDPSVTNPVVLSLDPDGAGSEAVALSSVGTTDDYRWQIVNGLSSFGPSATLVFTLPDNHTLEVDDQFELSYDSDLSVTVTVMRSFDYVLSVSSSSVREDAEPQDITVKVKVSDDTAESKDTYVILSLQSVTGLNSRFRITLPTLVIEEGKKEAEGQINFIPVPDGTSVPDETGVSDLIITIEGTAASGEKVKPVSITLIDTDKPSTKINLEFSDADISQKGGATDIEVKATLDGKTLRKDLSFSLVIDETGKDSATRDVDYSATLSTITIPDRRDSETTTITIRPKDVGSGNIWLKVPDDADLSNDDGQSIMVVPKAIEITPEPAKAIKGLTATPFSIREDSGPREIMLKVSLQNALLSDETVRFTIEDASDDLGDAFDSAVNATRDVDYTAEVPSLTIPKGETEGTTPIMVTPVDNNKEDQPRAFKVKARVGDQDLSTGILITDDDTTSDSITLEVNPTEISEGAGATEVTVTGTLSGKEFKDNVVVVLVINDDINGDGKVNDDDKAATRDVDYTASLLPLVIPAGEVSWTEVITITPTADDLKDDGEKIGLGTLSSKLPAAEDDDGDLQELTVDPATITLKDAIEEDEQPPPSDPARPAFTAADTISTQVYTVGTAIEPLVLPAATGGTGDLTYSISTLPAGLAFDDSTRTLSGTPLAVTDAPVNIIYTVIDGEKNATALIFSISVNTAETPIAATNAELTADLSSIREDAKATPILLTLTLDAARGTAEQVTFTIVGPSEGTPAVRDVDYTAKLGSVVTIPAGATVGTTTLTLAPINNTEMDSVRALGVRATFSSGAMLLTNIEIADDETPSTSIELSVNPHTIIEGSGEVEVTVTATLDGKALAENATVVVAIDVVSTASRDVDYAALFANPLIEIPAGSIMGATQLRIRIVDDDLAEGNETIKLIGAINGLMGDEAEITLGDQAPMTPDPDDPGDSTLAFADGTTIPNQSYTAGTPIPPLVLPEALGGTLPLRYSISALPAGLSFDAATRTISGDPSTVTDEAVSIIYTVVDSDGKAAALTFTIKVNAKLSFGDFFDFFGSSKVVPMASHDLAEIREFIVGQRVEALVLPEALGGTAPLTYSISPALPAGLTFDAATRTIAGTPQAAAETAYTYTVTDANGATALLSLQTLPTAFALADNFPNPFNPATTIQYALPQAADVELTVYNVVGQPVRTLVAEHQSAGRYVMEWDATDDSGHSLASGMYFYRLQVGGEFLEIKKMLLLK